MRLTVHREIPEGTAGIDCVTCTASSDISTEFIFDNTTMDIEDTMFRITLTNTQATMLFDIYADGSDSGYYELWNSAGVTVRSRIEI